MILHYFFAQRQSDTCARNVAVVVKPLKDGEYLILEFLVETDTIVGEFQEEVVAVSVE